MNDIKVKEITEKLENVFLPAMTASSVGGLGFSVKVRDVEDCLGGLSLITTTVNINRDIAPIEGFAPTQAEVVFEVDFSCDYNEKDNCFTWDGDAYTLNYNHYSNNILWAGGSIKDGEVPFESSNEIGIATEYEHIICESIVDKLFNGSEAETLKQCLRAIFEIASIKAVEDGWAVGQ